MQWRKLIESFQDGEHLIIDPYGSRKALAAVNHAMAHSI